tara:strand:- start:1822 stop:2748 length:927 start_codon:yes stop_codon:yes gene_type:complete
MKYNPEKLLILLYHGVTDVVSNGIENYSRKHLDFKLFQNQMRLLKSKYNVISMDDVFYMKRNNLKFPKRSVAITFDDGFENNYSIAAPILDKFKVPATFYICANIVNSETMFWVDKIEDCINRTKTKQIIISLGGRKKIFKLDTYKKKIKCVEIIKNYCKKIKVKQKDRIINDLINRTFVLPKITTSKNYEKLKWNQVKKMYKNSLFTIGSHSLNHEILSMQNKEQMKKDVSKSLQIFNKKLNTEIRHFSYPEGQKNHYNEYIIKFLKKSGILICPSAVIGQNSRQIDLFNLRRCMIGFKKNKIKNFF